MSKQIIILDDNNVRTVEIEGLLDISLSAELEKVLKETNEANDRKTILDLGKVSEVSPHGVRVLLNASLNQDETGMLALKNPNKNVTKLMKTVGLDHLVI